MEERQFLLDCADKCGPLLDELERYENEYALLTDKENEYKSLSGFLARLIVVFFILVSLVACLTSVSGLVFAALFSLPLIISVKNHNKRKARIPAVSKEINGIVNDRALSWLPPDYRDLRSARKIIEYLANMRAKTLQEAVNLLETERHRATMELIAAENLKQARFL